MKEDQIKILRTFFRVSNGIFQIRNEIQEATSGISMPSKMQQLHKMALDEIEKEHPNMEKMDKLLMMMENEAKYYEPEPNYPKGSI